MWFIKYLWFVSSDYYVAAFLVEVLLVNEGLAKSSYTHSLPELGRLLPR
jgi:hypothetical protein